MTRRYRPLKYIQKLTLILFVLGLANVGLQGCSKKEESAEKGAPKKASADAQLAVLEKSIVSLVPTDAAGFAFVDTESAGFKRYLASSWGTNGGLVNLKKLGNESGLVTALAKSGFDVSDPTSFSKDISSLAFFIESSDATTGPVIGLIAREKSGGSIEGKLAALKLALSSEPGFTIKDKTFGTTAGFQLTSQPSTDGEKGRDVFFAWNAETAVVASNEAIVTKVLGSSIGAGMPSVAKSPNFKSASEGTMDLGEVYASGYIDIEKLAASTSDPKSAEALKAMPFKALSFYGGMKDSPVTLARLTYDAAKMAALQKGWEIKSSPSGVVSSLLTHEPILLLSLDGSVLKGLVTLAKSSEPTAAAALTQYEPALMSITRISLAASSPAIGKSLLPIPDLLFAFESNKPEEVKSTLTGLGSMASALSGGMSNGKWSKKAIEGKDVESLESPMGVGLHVAQFENTIVATSTIPQMTDSIRANKGSQPSLLKSLAPSIAQPLTEDASIGLTLISFPEFVSFLKGIRDVAGMYVPNQAGSELMADEQLDMMRGFGISLVTAKSGPDLFEIKATYGKSTAAPTPDAAASGHSG